MLTMNKIDKNQLSKLSVVLTGWMIVISSITIGQDLSSLYSKLAPSVVIIHTLSDDSTPDNEEINQSLGSGVLVDSLGFIITASHVVHSANLIRVKMANGEEIFAEVVSSVPSADLALLKLKRLPESYKVAKLGDSNNVMIGEQVLVIGAPFGLEYSLSIGHISGRHTKPLVAGGASELEFFQTDAAINQGNSGGPMFNMKGEVIGIVSFILSNDGNFSGLGFAASINMAKQILLQNPSIWSGFEGLYLNSEIAGVFNVPQPYGILVQRVVEGSMADRIGLRAGKYKAVIGGQDVWIGGDIILEIQGTSCEAPHSFDKIKLDLENLGKDAPFSMKVLRAGKIIDLNGNMAY